MTEFLIYFVIFMPFLAGFAALAAGKRSAPLRGWIATAAGAAELMAAIALFVSGQDTAFFFFNFGGIELGFELDGFRRVYCLITAFMWFITLLFSNEYFKNYHNRGRYYLFNLITLGATMGVFLARDLAAVLLFFEIMSLTSFTWVIHDETPASIGAAKLYLYIAVFGGLAALMGIFLIQISLETLVISELFSAAQSCGKTITLYAAGALMFFGFGAKAGLFPLHIWMPKAHPVAPAPASALLSGILTKTGVFGVLAVSLNLFRHDPLWGGFTLCIGVITMLLGAVKALLSANLKRTLACSSISQIGFILVGVGAAGLLGHHGSIALRGVALHMLNHSLIKLCLFIISGAIYMNLHKLSLNDIRGFGRKKPLLMFCFLCGALSIGGIPLFGGYISKTLLHESLVECGAVFAGISWVFTTAEWLFIIAGGVTIAYMTKLFVAIFVEKHPQRQAEFDGQKKYMNAASSAAIVASSVLLPLLGCLPYATMDKLAELSMPFLGGGEVERINYFSLQNLAGIGYSVVIGALIYLVIVRRALMRRENGIAVYREFAGGSLTARIAAALLRGISAVTAFICRLPDLVARGAMPVIRGIARALGDLPDALVLLLKKTIFRERVPKSDDHLSRSLAYRLGHELDTVASHGKSEKYARQLVRADTTIRKTTTRITSNFSLALLALCAALTLVFLYMLFFHK